MELPKIVTYIFFSFGSWLFKKENIFKIYFTCNMDEMTKNKTSTDFLQF